MCSQVLYFLRLEYNFFGTNCLWNVKQCSVEASSMFRADAAAGDTVTLDQVPKAVMATVPDEQCGAGDWIRRHHAVVNADDGTPLIPVAPAKAKKEK